MRVGILGQGFIGWAGGLDFLRMVCSSLVASGAPVELHLLLPNRGPQHLARVLVRRARTLAAAAVGRTRAVAFSPSPSSVREALRSADATIRIHAIDEGAGALRRSCQRLALDVVLPSIVPFGGDLGTPWVGYVYDFQHHHLPQLFNPRECALRDRDFARMLELARVIVVNSQAVANDARAFRPHARARIVPLPFSAAPSPAWFDLDIAAVQADYNLIQPYFIVCNQFWAHKDHMTALAAFAAFAGRHDGVDLVCTGATEDYRAPGHFAGLMRFVAECRLMARVHVLGQIPKAEQIALLRGAIALLQPTLFEGGPGGGAVYDAVSLGVPSIISDIEVNREISENAVAFFPVREPEPLARMMEEAFATWPRADVDRAELLQRGQLRRQRCGLALIDAIEEARA